MVHRPSWHIINETHPDSNRGLEEPVRVLTINGEHSVAPGVAGENFNLVPHQMYGLSIESLDRADPPGYQPGDYPREDSYNKNIFRISGDPRMPEIHVRCSVQGFDVTEAPIFWRLVCRTVICRFRRPRGAERWRYEGRTIVLEREWRGVSRLSYFSLFDPLAAGLDSPALGESDLEYTFNDPHPDSIVGGGNAILTVLARPPGSQTYLQDYVHLRIVGTNPGRERVWSYLESRLDRYDDNIVIMLKAIFEHEAGLSQFNDSPMGVRGTYRIRFGLDNGRHEDAAQPDCRINFSFPRDPTHFPLVSYDCGVGIGQFTEVGSQRLDYGIVWDWRHQVDICVNLFLDKLRSSRGGVNTWAEWAWAGWRRYNGSGPAAIDYANDREASATGRQVSRGAIPDNVVLTPLQLRSLNRGRAAPWPPWEVI